MPELSRSKTDYLISTPCITMGVPALFRWLSRKYPRIVESVKEIDISSNDDFSPPNPNEFEVDNLFLDMNGIIHPCCHPQDKPAPATEEEMMKEIFKYLDRIMRMVRPRKLVYMAIDGVAPRAKMNQQRSRRFRAAKEAKEKREGNEATLDNLESKESHAFDSNVITPGTPFMRKISDAIKSYIYHRMNENRAWKNLKVVFSDWTVPGEGEHKIVDFIRRQRLDPEFDANQQNVIYGLDADLIMLTMATHEAQFRVLREDVFWEEEQKRGQCRNCLQTGHLAADCPHPPCTDPKSDPHQIKPFIFLNVTILREYLEVEMRPSSSSFPFDPERAIDDWVFLCFFVGNDFLPHLPSLELREGAIDTLIEIYRANADVFAGPLTKDGLINFDRVQVILEELSKQEAEILRRRKERDDRRDANIKRRKLANEEVPLAVAQASAENRLEIRAVSEGPADSHAALEVRKSAKRSIADVEDDTSVADEVRLHEPGARNRYYISKFGKDPRDNPDFVRAVCKSYLEGVAWVMGYYYQGCPSWKWFYPYHYAPFAADFIEYLDSKDECWQKGFKFELGKPFRPYDQLLSVFPAASAGHIPEPFRRLMLDPESELIEFYPEEFAVDLNGKKQAWQGVALLPFIDEDRLLVALEKIYPQLNEDYVRLNRRGHDLLFVGEASTAFGFLCTIDSDPDGIWPLDVLLTKGLSGSVRIWNEAPGAVGDDFELFEYTISNNQVVGVLFYPPGVSGQESTLKMHFPARLLPSARLVSVLSPEERAAVRSGQSHSSHNNNRHHSMNRDWAQKQESEHSYFKQPSRDHYSNSRKYY